MFTIKELIARATTRVVGFFSNEERSFVYLVTDTGKIKRFYIDDLMKEAFPERS